MFIIVEGASEKIYFERFRTPNSPVAVRIHESKDRDAEGMIRKCMHIIERSGLDTETDDVMAVFDADRNCTEDIQKAKELCSEHGIKMYISNPSFEFWLLLHFEDDSATYIKDDLRDKLSKHLGVKYVKSAGINEYIEDKDILKAIERSKKLLPDADPLRCANIRPSTCLHLLVEKLMKKRPP